MMRSRGTGWTATVAGLVGGLIWSMWVAFSMPSWFDAGDSCTGGSLPDAYALAETSWLPPGATCVYTAPSGAVERVPFIGAGMSFLMSVVAVALIGCTVAGLGRIAHRLLLEPDPRADPQPGRGPWWATGHAVAAGLLGVGVAVVGGRTAYLVTVITTGAGLAFAFVGVAVLAAVAATQVDRRIGPGGTRLDARRRGTAVGLMGTAATFGLVYATGGQALLPSFEPVWWAAIGAAVFALLAALQRLGAATPPSPAHFAQH